MSENMPGPSAEELYTQYETLAVQMRDLRNILMAKPDIPEGVEWIIQVVNVQNAFNNLIEASAIQLAIEFNTK